MSEVLVDFDSKKQPIAEWVNRLSGIPLENIRGADEFGKYKYPAAILAEISEIDTHRPFRVTEIIDGELKYVTYHSKQVNVDFNFITKDTGDYMDDQGRRTLDAKYYMTQFNGKLFLPEESIEFLSANGLSLLNVGNPIRTDQQKNDGWLRTWTIEIGLGYVMQTAEPIQNLEAIKGIVGAVHINGDIIEIEMDLGPYQLREEKGQPNGYASLDENAKVPVDQIPETAKVSVYIVASEIEQLALTVQQGDIAIRTDESKSYVALNNVNASMSDWHELLSPGLVTSVDGKTGVVNLSLDYAALSHSLTAHSGITGTEDNFMSLDASGLPKDSGYGPDDLGASKEIVVSKSASDSAALSDAEKTIEYLNGANDYIFTFEPDSTTDFPVGSWLNIRKTGSGKITLARGSGVSFRGIYGNVDLQIDGTDGLVVWAVKTAANTWLFVGAIDAA